MSYFPAPTRQGWIGVIGMMQDLSITTSFGLDMKMQLPAWRHRTMNRKLYVRPGTFFMLSAWKYVAEYYGYIVEDDLARHRAGPGAANLARVNGSHGPAGHGKRKWQGGIRPDLRGAWGVVAGYPNYLQKCLDRFLLSENAF
ncbi:hypothetical protein [Komagataeibacter europaeus]|uniref:hypothetical protein n=1 Tax=Komagataeibacter europaeus TaxID=33995 RepID=UPI000B3E98A1|nr:hypothetical protein [Komagataeibacter europaeus]ARW18236.1 hypothetical protein S101446_03161 [Komagataeibacter europaeus]